MRKLTNDEKEALLFLASNMNKNEIKKLTFDINICSVTEKTEDGSILSITIDGYERGPYKGQHQYNFEGEIEDKDGEKITVCVYADANDRLLEIEMIKWTGAKLIKPNWRTITKKY